MRKSALCLCVLALLFAVPALGQDVSTGALRIHLIDPAGQPVSAPHVIITSSSMGTIHVAVPDASGAFLAAALPPGDYDVRATADGLSGAAHVRVEVGAEEELRVTLRIPGAKETVAVTDQPLAVETQPAALSTLIDERAIDGLPLNGRRFTDLALLSPGVSTDPRGLTSGSYGDLAFGGLRGFHTSFTVDGTDSNNSFFSQARGRYRAPYQFSNEVVQEFRVSTNTYGVEQGRSGSAVVNVVTKSGSNFYHGSAFTYVRDSMFDARNPYLDYKPSNRQEQVGATFGGPIKKNRIFFYSGFDQHIFRVPTVVQFADGSTQLTPTPADFESTDAALVAATAQKLSQMGGTFQSKLLGNAGFAKVDWTLSPRYQLALRVNTSRYWGANNVFFDPASPITNFAMSENGEERVQTETAAASLTTAMNLRWTSHFRAQFSRDVQNSIANSTDVRTRIYDVISAFGRSSMLPRDTREHKLQFAETMNYDGRTHRWKFGADVMPTFIRNYYPMLQGGEYIFDNIKVNPWTFDPMVRGLELTPLRAYAHNVPRYYLQNFGDPVTHPDTNEYSLFVQDTIRVNGRLALTLGLRYDLQTFRQLDGGTSYWSGAGKLPSDNNNIAPRAGFAYSLGNDHPVVLRGGFGIFYTRVPQIYTSTIETYNGLNRGYLFLDNANYYDHLVMPTYPNPLASCGLTGAVCTAPASVSDKIVSEVAAFSPKFQTPYVQQGSFSVEREVGGHIAIGANYVFTHGVHLIRARDGNLPEPTIESYPVFDDSGTFTGSYYDVASFAPWVTTRTLDCAYPPCIGTVVRPIPQLDAVNVFESEASSVYHALTLSAQRRFSRGLYFRAAYTYGKAIDDGQDALVAGRPVTVQNSYATSSERGLSVTDQRHRVAFSWMAAPRPFHREHPFLRAVFNNWKIANVVTFGSGRPVNALITGDANLDGNSGNDRLPGYRRNSFTGPNYFTIDARLARTIQLHERYRLEFMVESFNLSNRANKRVDVSDDGFTNSAGTFVSYSTTVSSVHYPAYYRKSGKFLVPNNSYAPRQVQFGCRFRF